MSSDEQLPTVALSDIFEPDSLAIEDYGNNRPTKVYVAGTYAKRDQGASFWSALYGDVKPSIRKIIEPRLVNGELSALQLVRQFDSKKLVAVATPTCHIGHVRYAIVESLGDCKLPWPFETLDDLAR